MRKSKIINFHFSILTSLLVVFFSNASYAMTLELGEILIKRKLGLDDDTKTYAIFAVVKDEICRDIIIERNAFYLHEHEPSWNLANTYFVIYGDTIKFTDIKHIRLVTYNPDRDSIMKGGTILYSEICITMPNGDKAYAHKEKFLTEDNKAKSIIFTGNTNCLAYKGTAKKFGGGQVGIFHNTRKDNKYLLGISASLEGAKELMNYFLNKDTYARVKLLQNKTINTIGGPVKITLTNHTFVYLFDGMPISVFKDTRTNVTRFGFVLQKDEMSYQIKNILGHEYKQTQLTGHNYGTVKNNRHYE